MVAALGRRGVWASATGQTDAVHSAQFTPSIEHTIPTATMNEHGKLNYVEFPCTQISRTKAFFEQALGWSFVDYGPDYTSFADQGLDGGFFTSEQCATTKAGSALLILYSARLEEKLGKVESAGGTVIQPIFSFPGGRRFHFTEPSGNEFAVWSE